MEQPNNTPAQKPPEATVWKDLVGSLVDFDHGIPGTLKALVIKPAEVLQSYLRGERLYVNPFKMLLLFTGLYYLLHTFMIDQSVYMQNMFKSMRNADVNGQLGGQVTKQIEEIMKQLQSQYGMLSTVVLTLFIAISTWLFFRRTFGSFATSLAASSYVLTAFMALSLVVMLPAEILMYKNEAFFGAYLSFYNWLFMVFILVGFARIFNFKKVGHYFKMVLSILVAYMLYTTLLFVAVGLVVGLKG